MSVTTDSQRRRPISARPDRTLLVFHAERLHEDAVWRRVLPIAEGLSEASIRLTFFVFPYRAEAVGADLTARVGELSDLGHEIAQHTHFYAGKTFMTDQKADDLGDANVIACLDRDSGALRAMGVRAHGFTAGAWQLPEAALETLLDLDFEYDCSGRHPQPGVGPVNPHHRWIAAPETYDRDGTSLVLLPTTCSLGQWFKWGRKTVITGPPEYQMVYLHDYDLLVPRTRLMLAAFLRLRRSTMGADVHTLAGDLLASTADHERG